jgi:hypothetical protein
MMMHFNTLPIQFIANSINPADSGLRPADLPVAAGVRQRPLAPDLPHSLAWEKIEELDP